MKAEPDDGLLFEIKFLPFYEAFIACRGFVRAQQRLNTNSINFRHLNIDVG